MVYINLMYYILYREIFIDDCFYIIVPLKYYKKHVFNAVVTHKHKNMKIKIFN